MKNCIICGKSFVPAKFQSTQQKYCSAECRSEAGKEKDRLHSLKYYYKHQKEYSEKRKNYRSINKNKIKEQKRREYLKHKDKYIQYRKYRYEKNKQDPDYLLAYRWANQGHKKRGMSFDEFKKFFDLALKNQHGKCAICGVMFKTNTDVRVDHNHKTNELRGLLCDNCNVGIEKFHENVIYLSDVIIYLNQYKT